MSRDLALGAAMLAIAVGYYAMAAAIPDTLLADEVGPGGLPTAYAGLLAALSLILVAGSLTRARRTALSPTPPAVTQAGQRAPGRAAGMIGIGVLYLVATPWLGYAPSLAGLIVATTHYQGRRLTGRTVLVAVAGAAVFWLLFVQLLRVPHPPGIWPELFNRPET